MQPLCVVCGESSVLKLVSLLSSLSLSLFPLGVCVCLVVIAVCLFQCAVKDIQDLCTTAPPPPPPSLLFPLSTQTTIMHAYTLKNHSPHLTHPHFTAIPLLQELDTRKRPREDVDELDELDFVPSTVTNVRGGRKSKRTRTAKR